MKKTLLQALIIVTVSLATAFLVNLLRPEPLAWVAKTPYNIYSDCPEHAQHALPLTIDDVEHERDFFVDARKPEQFEAEHIPGAFPLTWDSLFPVDDVKVKEISEAAAGWRIVVYGDMPGAKILADDLFSHKIGLVYYLEGGLEAWQKAGYETEKKNDAQ